MGQTPERILDNELLFRAIGVLDVTREDISTLMKRKSAVNEQTLELLHDSYSQVRENVGDILRADIAKHVLEITPELGVQGCDYSTVFVAASKLSRVLNLVQKTEAFLFAERANTQTMQRMEKKLVESKDFTIADLLESGEEEKSSEASSLEAVGMYL
jgi:hypothetical protein